MSSASLVKENIKKVINHPRPEQEIIRSDESDENSESGTPLSSTHENPQKSQEGSVEILIAVPTPPPSGISSKSVPKKINYLSIPQNQPYIYSKVQAPTLSNSSSIESMFETFHQSPSGEFKPTFYNPFEVKHRRRTSRSQVKILERAFMENCKPTALLRKALARELNMSARSIQVWFQNRRAKLKTLLKNGKMTENQIADYLGQQSKEQTDSDDEEVGNQETETEESDDEQDISCKQNASVNRNVPQQPEKYSSKIFENERRTFPNYKQCPNPVVSCVPENMKFGNTYPNQVRIRSYSLPEIQRSPNLPFKQLQEALFGTSHQASYLSQDQAQAQHIQNQTQTQVPAPLTESSYYSSSLNAFQNYFRATNAALLQSQGNYYTATQSHQNSSSNTTPTSAHIQLPQLNFPPLNQVVPCEYQVDPNRFRRPRSSSFAVGHRQNSTPNYPHNIHNQEDYDARHSMLSVIKEDSPISSYMNLPSSFDVNMNIGMDMDNTHNDVNDYQTRSSASGCNNIYFNAHDQDSSELSNQINSLDLDYFMSASHQMNEYSLEPSSNSSSLSESPPDSSQLNLHSSRSHNSYQLHSHHHNHQLNNNFMPEMAFLPQPSNEILLSTLIDDEHFLH